jgi:hypothetical protein
MKNRRYAQALTILNHLPEARPKLVAECYEELGQFAKAAPIYLELGDREKALTVLPVFARLHLGPGFSSADRGPSGTGFPRMAREAKCRIGGTTGELQPCHDGS